MPRHSRVDRAMGWAAMAPMLAALGAGFMLAATVSADEPAPAQPRVIEQRVQRGGMVLQHRIVIQQGDGQPEVNEIIQRQLELHQQQLDEVWRQLDVQRLELLEQLQIDAGRAGVVWDADVQVLLDGRPMNPAGAGNRAVWINDARAMQQGLGLTQFNRLDRMPREEMTPDRVLDLLGWSGMSAMHGEEPLDITGWPTDRVLDALNDPDAATRRRATRALALSERFNDEELLLMLTSKDLTLEQRSRLLDVSFARFVAAPRAAVGASFNTGVPITISGLFQGFPAAHDNILRVGDELLEIDGQSLLHPNAFNTVRATVLSRQAGETVRMVIRRPFAPDEVARIRREQMLEQEARAAQARAEAEARIGEIRRETTALKNDANALWENDPVWQRIVQQMEVLEAKNPEAGMEITPEGDVIFGRQRLGNIAHLDGVVARGARAIVADPREHRMDLEELITPGRTMTIEVPLGSLAELQRNGGGTGGPGIADLHSAWLHRLNGLGIEPRAVTADSVEIRTPELGWVQTHVGQRVSTLISPPRSPRQHTENSMAMNQIIRHGANRAAWNQHNAMVAEHWTPDHAPASSLDTTAFRVQRTELTEPEVQLRRHAAVNEAARELASLRERRAALARRLQAQPIGAAADALQQELDTLDRRIETLESQLRVTRRR